jgi:Icc protein
MSACCHVSRREALRWGALVAATPLLSLLPDPERAYAATATAPVPMNLELVTLTETSVVLTWFTGQAGATDEFGRLTPQPATGEVLLGTSPARLRQAYVSDSPTPYHYAEITGLEPGQTYFYLALSNGIPAVPSTFAVGNPASTGTLSRPTSAGGPYVFTTPQPPPGRFLFSIALANDIHMGETVAGQATSVNGMSVPPGFSQVPGEPPYPEVMAESMVADARARGAHRLIIAGDVTSEAAPTDQHRARQILDGFGTYGVDYRVTRGNHDRSHSGATYDHCRVDPRGAGLYDCFHDEWFPGDTPTWFRQDVQGLRLLGLDTYDKVGTGADNGMLSAAQFDWVASQLAAEPDRPTLVFGHHPVTIEESVVNLEPVVFDLQPQQALQLTDLYGKAPGVFLHHAGHSHRNYRAAQGNATNVTFQEVGATKEYPGGFSLLRVHEGGFAVNFYKTRSALAREWSERTRQEDFGGAPFYTFGSIGDRNYVRSVDLSGITAPGSSQAGSTAAGPPSSDVDAGAGPGGPSTSATGSRGELAFTGLPDVALPAAALVAGGAAAWALRRSQQDPTGP